MKTEAKRCTQCDEELSGAGLWGLCIKCLYGESMGGETEAEREAPRRIGKFELQEVLGRGGMGVVYRAIQSNPQRTVALKMILDAELASETARRRFTLEAEVAASLDHPNIVPIYEVGEHEGQAYLSMKLVVGDTLRKMLDDGKLTLAKAAISGHGNYRERAAVAAHMMIAIANAVQHAHQRGILHRDLKPGNIIIDASGRPYLTDFGLAKMLDANSGRTPLSVTLPGGALGTPSYMSPEQARGQRLTEASDIYSLGAILYEVLTGKPPFRAGTPLETLRMVVEEQPRGPRAENPRVDKDLDTICLKCLEKNRARRYLTAGALAEDLDRWLKHEPIQARPAGLALRSGRWIERNRVGTALIATLCAGLVISLLLLEQTLARQRKLDAHRANNVLAMIAEMDELWKDPDKRFVQISSSLLAELADLPATPPDALTRRLTVAQSINHEPFGQAMQYAPFLHQLEVRAAEKLGHPVAVDLRLYKEEAEALEEMLRGKLAVLRMDPLLFILANEKTNKLAVIARERSEKEAVIFARKDAGITHLAQIAGRGLCFGKRDSVVTFWAKVHLARAGISEARLASCTYISSDLETAQPAAGQKLSADRDPHLQANKRVIQAVAVGHAEIGVTTRRQFELSRYRKPGLVELHAYRVPSDLYAATLRLEPEVRRALQQSLTSFQTADDKKVLSRLSESVLIEGFEPVLEEEFREMRMALRNELIKFDGANTER